VGLFSRLHRFHRRLPRHSHPNTACPQTSALGLRICRFEEMEPRQYLSASPIQVGAVYYEDATQDDRKGDTIEITWSGGASGTQLTDLVIDTDKEGNGLTIGDCLFDTESGGVGAYGSLPLEIVSKDGIDKVEFSVVDGGTRLALNFSGFEAGERLIFTIDVDEMGFLGANAVAEGNEWEGTKMTGTFSASHYAEVSGTDIFRDFYDDKLTASGLALPPDDYIPPGVDPEPVFTAGAIFSLQQKPLPITLSGTVFEDMNGNNTQDNGDAGIAGVSLTLYALQDSQFVATSLTAVTDANGNYQFDGLEPGTYRIAETQPSGYLSIGARAGTVDGQTRGSVTDADTLSGIALEGGDKSLHNDFAEARPASISGYVYADDNMNGVKDGGEAPIAGVKLALTDAKGNPSGLTATTDAAGFYRFTDLKPGAYGVSETQPDGYFDGLDIAGTAGGAAQNPGDSITGAVLRSGTKGLDYDFGEIRPAELCGRVYVDLNNNGVFDSGETPLAGVTVYLLDASGSRIATATSSQDGSYCFARLRPGTNGVEEVQPSRYLDGKDSPGTVGGVLDGNDRIIQIKLVPGTDAEKYDFGELLPARISGCVFVDLPAVTYKKGTQPPSQIELLKTHDGVLRSEDERLAGVVLRLGDANGVPFPDEDHAMTAVTDAQGYYEFDNLPPGVYTVIQEHPAGYVDGVNTPGTKGGLAINALTTQENPEIATGLAFDTSKEAIIRIRLQMGDWGENYNFSELVLQEVSSPNPPIPPPPPSPSPPSLEPPAQPFFPDRLPPVLLLGPGMAGQGLLSLYGGGGYEPEYTWHLSVIDAGRPRQDREKGDLIAGPEDVYFNAVSWNGTELSGGQWILADGEGKPAIRQVFGVSGAVPVTGDWNGDGTTKIGVFYDGFWFLDLNGDGRWGKEDLWARLGQAGDRPVAGDWDGDGKTDIGIFGPAWAGDHRAIRNEPGLPDVNNRIAANPQARYKNIPPEPEQATSGWRTLKRTAFGKFRKDLIDHVFLYGDEKHVAVTGDWNGDGVTNIGIFYNGTWFLDADGDGQWSAGDVEITLGQAGDIPVVGDFNGDGRAKLGVYRNGTWLLDTNGDGVLDARDRVFHLGEPGDVPVVGDWNGDGIDEIGVYRAGTPAAAKQASTQSAPGAAPQSAEPAIKR
jgi:protocatechuate 3,4-dioxygenase beta subunit